MHIHDRYPCMYMHGSTLVYIYIYISISKKPYGTTLAQWLKIAPHPRGYNKWAKIETWARIDFWAKHKKLNFFEKIIKSCKNQV